MEKHKGEKIAEKAKDKNENKNITSLEQGKDKSKKNIAREYEDKQNSAGFSDNEQDGGDYYFTCNRQCVNKKKS